MEKIVNKNEKSFIKFLLFFLVWIVGIIVLLFIVSSILIKDENIMTYYVTSLVVGSGLIVYYLFFKLVYNNKPKYIDGKYVWKDGRIYEGDWDKQYGSNGKGKLTWADGSYYEGDFKNGHLSGKGKKVCPSGGSYEGDWGNDEANGIGKSLFLDGSYYEGEFKKGKPNGMGVIKMKNGYYYEGEFSDGKRTGRFKKQILITGGVIEGEFRDNGNDGFDGIGRVTTSDGFTFEGTFQNGKLNGEGKMITPEGAVLLGTFENGELKKGRQILNNGEYSEGNWIDGHLTGIARYYFKDGSYYEGESGDTGWQGIGTYVAKNGDKYSTEFPYGVVDVFLYGLNSKMKEIQGNLNYVAKSTKEKIEERDKYLEISGKGTPIQKEIAKMFLDFYAEDDKFLDSIKQDRSINNYISVFSNMNKYYGSVRKNCKQLSDNYHIKSSSKGLYSYGEFFSRLDLFFDGEIKLGDSSVKIYRFLNPEHVLDFIIKKDQKDKEWIGLIDEFSKVYGENIKLGLDWREYENKFWEHNFKSDKKSE